MNLRDLIEALRALKRYESTEVEVLIPGIELPVAITEVAFNEDEDGPRIIIKCEVDG